MSALRRRVHNPAPKSMRGQQVFVVRSVAGKGKPRPQPSGEVIEFRSLAPRKSNPKKKRGSTMAKKKSHGRRKKRRTAAQKRATAALVAMNRRKRHGGKKRHRKHNPAPKRRKARKLHGAKLAAFTRKHPHRKRGRKHPTRKKGMFRKRNPAMPLWMKVLIGTAAGVAVPVAARAVARRFMPDKAALVADVAAAAGVLGGIYLAKKRPFIGSGIAAGSAAGALVPMLSAHAEAAIAPAGSSQEAGAQARVEGLKFLEAVSADDLGAAHAPHPATAAYHHANKHARFMRGLGAVTADDMSAVTFQY